MSKSAPKRFYQKIGLAIKERILSGEFSVGDRLPPERDFAQEMQVSRSVVREAIIMLELQEVVEVRQGSGVYVINLPGHSAGSINTPESEAETEADIGPFELLQARQVLESQIASFAAQNVTKNDVLRMREAIELQRRQLTDGSDDDDGDKQFHLAVAEATQNSVLTDMVIELWDRRERSPMWQQLHQRIPDLSYRKAWIKDHENVLLAIQRRNAEDARTAMLQHFENVKQVLLELSDTDDQHFDGFLFS
ncbi:FCD domain-containing protein [Endozoicomonas ascidiicola]|uniref:FCD domain-containing protein n=1 Tax=Endozoicomonas ascidiicola TaxID=1698521 RepID=UPI001C12CE53|nr:FCD domain-containing protein [Endozoicomonas ascidiicola]